MTFKLVDKLSTHGSGPGMQLRMQFSPHDKKIGLNLDGEDRVVEFLMVLQRACQTWEDPPAWAIEILDKAQGIPPPAKPVDRPNPNKPDPKTPAAAAAVPEDLQPELYVDSLQAVNG